MWLNLVMTSSAALHQQWGSVVDAIAGMNSKEDLPREYVPTRYLPQQVAIPADILESVRKDDADSEAKAAALFQPQIGFEEGLHAKPTLPRFSSRTNDATFSLDDPDGPDFYSAYRAVAAAPGEMNQRALGSTSRLTSGFIDPAYYASIHRQPDFMPIILVPSSVSSPLQLMNVRNFLERGAYVDPPTLYVDEETGTANVQDTKPDTVIVSPGSFLDSDKYRVAFTQFRVVDDPAQVKNWDHVCGCIVDGKQWQFMGWYPSEPASACEPSVLFSRIRGFLPYFEEDKVPAAITQWRVQPLVLTRRIVKAHQHILQASVFWEQLYTFLDAHPLFKLYTVRPDE